MKQAGLDWDLDPAEWTAAAPPAPRAPAPPPTETAVLDERGRVRLGTVLEALPGTAYPYTAACGACGARQSGWASVWSAEMWVRHHRRTCAGAEQAMEGRPAGAAASAPPTRVPAGRGGEPPRGGA